MGSEIVPNKAYILVVDDDREITRGMMLRLRSKGYEVSTADSGEQAMVSVAERIPDAMVLDIRMPGMDGLEVLSKLKSDDRFCGIPIIICSASLVDKKDALGRGASYFVQKPYDTTSLIQAVAAVLESSDGKGLDGCERMRISA